MRGIILVGDESFSLESIKKIQFTECIKDLVPESEGRRIALHYKDGSTYFDKNDGLIYYDEEEIGVLRQLYSIGLYFKKSTVYRYVMPKRCLFTG